MNAGQLGISVVLNSKGVIAVGNTLIPALDLAIGKGVAVLVPDKPGLALWKLYWDALPLNLGDHFVFRYGHIVALLLRYGVAFSPARK